MNRIFAAVVIGLGTYCGFSMLFAEKNKRPDRIMAFTMCQNPALEMLRAPHTAKFPAPNASGVSVLHLGNGVYKVDSFVDAQNGFGGWSRQRYVCEIQELQGSRWKTITFSF